MHDFVQLSVSWHAPRPVHASEVSVVELTSNYSIAPPCPRPPCGLCRISFFVSVYYASLALKSQSQEMLSRLTLGTPIMVLFVASLVELAVAADHCAHFQSCTGAGAYAVAAGCLSAAFCLVILLLAQLHKNDAVVGKILSVFLVIIWCAAAAVNTGARGETVRAPTPLLCCRRRRRCRQGLPASLPPAIWI